MLLKLIYDGLLSTFAFNFNLRRYIMVDLVFNAWLMGRGLHSSTFELNVSTFFGIRWLASVCQWPKRLRLLKSCNVDECKPLLMGKDNLQLIMFDDGGRGLHSSTSQINLSRF